MNVNFEAIEKACDKPKKTALDELEEDIKQRLADFKTNKEYFIDERDLEDILDKIQELKKKVK